jgi:hypothetical protein
MRPDHRRLEAAINVQDHAAVAAALGTSLEMPRDTVLWTIGRQDIAPNARSACSATIKMDAHCLA